MTEFPTDRCHLGMSPSGIAEMESKLPGVRHSMMRWFMPDMDRDVVSYPDVTRATAAGRLVLFSVKPRQGGRIYHHDQVAEGALDSWFQRQRQKFVEWGQPIIGIYGPEPESVDEHDMFGLEGARRESVEAAEAQVAAHEHILDIFEGVENVRWAWCGAGGMVGLDWVKRYVPTDPRLGYVAADPYNWCPESGRSTNQTPFSTVSKPLRELGRLRKKPILIPEVGCWDNPMQAAWIDDMAKTIEDWPRLKGLTWFQNHTHCDWRIRSAESVAAWGRLFANPRFLNLA